VSVLDFPDGSTWNIPGGWTFRPQEKPKHCRSCDARVLWLTSKAGRHAPFDPDGKSHFATCPDAPEWRKSR
jgi:hypothetical protein